MELPALINECGLGEHSDAIMSVARPSVTVRPIVTEQKRLGARDSRLGGLPHMPRGTQWPRWRKSPLSHLGTINLAEASKHDVRGLLPREGLLVFWYDQAQGAWGFDPKEAGFFRVDYLSGAEELEVLQPPRDVEPFRACAIEFGANMTVPNWEWMRTFAPALEAITDLDGYEQLEEALSRGQRHQMLGHAAPVQAPMELECQLVSHGLYCGDSSGYNDARAKELEGGSLDWRLLLQLDTDEDGPGWMWGDVGTAYFWIPEAALKARRFGESWMILQCC